MERLLSALWFLQSEAPEDFPVDMETIWLISIVTSIVLLIVGIAVGYWIYKDASKRENNELLWAGATGGMMILFFPIGIVLLITYFVLRGDPTETEPSGVEAETQAEW